jgi:hypothetical protein
MSHPIPAPHAAVALRSHRRLDRTLLIIALAAILALTAAVVIATNSTDQVNPATKAAPAVPHQPQTQAGTRYDGGPDEGTRGAVISPPAAGSRYDGGPEEGTRGPQQLQFKERAGGPTMMPQGPPGAR